MLRIRIRIIFGKLDLDPHQSEKVEACLFWSLEFPNLEKVSGRIRIRIRIKFKGRIRIRIIVKGRIWIRIRLKQDPDPDPHQSDDADPQYFF
jgi:hypothetical protein